MSLQASQTSHDSAEAVADARALLAAIVESSDDAIVSKSLDGTILSWNAAAERLYGYSAIEAVGQSITLIIPPELHDEERVILERLGRGEKIAHFETVRVAKDGRRFDISLTISPLRDRAGRIVGASKVARNITKRKRTEEALRESETQLRMVLDHAAVYLARCDKDRLFRFVNRGYAERFGLKPDDFVGRSVEEMLGADAYASFRRYIDIVLSGKRVKFDVEVPYQGLGPRFMHCVYEPEWDTAGQVQGFVAVIIDISDRKQAEQALRRNEESSRFVAEASRSLASITDYESTLQTVARLAVPHFADWCVVDMVEASGALRRIAVAHVDPAKVNFADELRQKYPPDPHSARGPYRVLRTGESEIIEEIPDSMLVAAAQDEEHLRILRGLGLKSYMCVPIQTRHELLGVLTFILAESGRRYHMADLQVAEDLGRRAGIAIDNSRLYSQLKEADRRKDEFLATLAHELRNPLAPIRNSLEILKAADEDRDLRHLARDTMERQLAHLVRLVDDLLDVSRITRNKLELRVEHVELASIIHHAVETCRPLVESARQELKISLPDEPIYLHADSMRLAQVFSNLINNACKYSEPGGTVSVAIERQGDEVVVSVKDGGVGIAPEMLPAIFDMFTQVDHSLERSAGGLGIGLTLVKRLVEMHGGTVTASSAGPGQGSTFVVRLPISADAPPAASPKPALMPIAARRILVVDDNVDSARSLAMLLNRDGNETATAHDGAQALEAAEAFQPEVILLDIGLPKMNGYDVCRAIRQQPWGENMVIVALSGWGQEEDRQRSRQAGCDAHVVKPVDLHALATLLAELCA